MLRKTSKKGQQTTLQNIVVGNEVRQILWQMIEHRIFLITWYDMMWLESFDDIVDADGKYNALDED